MIAIIDYKAGNIASVSNALTRLGADFCITDDVSRLNDATGIIFPGVGHAYAAMQALKEKNLDEWLKSTQKPVLGICLGMQMLFDFSVEGDTACLGLIPGKLEKFDNSKGKVPHMGWNTLRFAADSFLLKGLSVEDYFYFVHSFYAPVVDATTASCFYADVDFSAVVSYKNFHGVQFHPEKSGAAGTKILNNFINYVNEGKE